MQTDDYLIEDTPPGWSRPTHRPDWPKIAAAMAVLSEAAAKVEMGTDGISAGSAIRQAYYAAKFMSER